MTFCFNSNYDLRLLTTISALERYIIPLSNLTWLWYQRLGYWKEIALKSTLILFMFVFYDLPINEFVPSAQPINRWAVAMVYYFLINGSLFGVTSHCVPWVKLKKKTQQQASFSISKMLTFLQLANLDLIVKWDANRPNCVVHTGYELQAYKVTIIAEKIRTTLTRVMYIYFNAMLAAFIPAWTTKECILLICKHMSLTTWW